LQRFTTKSKEIQETSSLATTKGMLKTQGFENSLVIFVVYLVNYTLGFLCIYVPLVGFVGIES